MSNGLYTGNNDLPTMTRSEYIAEYHEITTYFDKENKLLKKHLPFCIVLSIINVLVVIGLIAAIVPIMLDNMYDNQFISYRERERIAFSLVMPCVLSFPLASVVTRMKQIKKKENERLQDLEDRKSLCMEIGTYNSEK